jgi:hypothetical protein
LNPNSTQYVPKMASLRTRIDDNVSEKIKEIQPTHLSRQAFINELILLGILQKYKEQNNMALYIHKDKELDKEGLERKEQKEKINKKEKQEKIIPEDLKHLQTLIDDFWKVKKGSKSIKAWKQQIEEYRKFIRKYGEQVLKDQLEAGILAGTWKGCTIKNYESIRKINNPYVQEEKVHPNQKVVQFDEMGNLI